MKLLFLGTASAEGWPGLFCNCEHCKKAKRLGGKNIRFRSSIQLDDIYKIDFPPDSYTQMLKFSLDYHSLRHLFITHTHDDHFAVNELKWRVAPFAYFNDKDNDVMLTVYGNESAEKKFNSIKEKLDKNIIFSVLQPYKEYVINNDISITPIISAHGNDIGGCYNYIIKTDKNVILIGYDTGWYPEKTWEFIYKIPFFNIVVFDATMQNIDFGDKPYGHLGFKNLITIKYEMEKKGVISKDTKFIATHFSHNGGMLHEDMIKFLSPYNIIPAYDGLSFEV